jgi:hypothetical protein
MPTIMWSDVIMWKAFILLSGKSFFSNPVSVPIAHLLLSLRIELILSLDGNLYMCNLSLQLTLSVCRSMNLKQS